jgi:serine/threonine protein phosphatase 1
MKPYVYVISDIHGQLDLFKKLLESFDPVHHQLVLIGDLNDRGKKSKECFLLGKELVEKYGAIYLRGNHEEYFLQFLHAPEDWMTGYVRNGGKETIDSLLHPGATEEYSPTEIAMMIRSRYKDLVDFLMDRPLSFEWGKTIVFGHTITPMLHGDMKTTDLWISDHKIGIDGGAVFGGSVHGVIFDQKGIVQDIEYQNVSGPWQPDF